VIGYFSAIAALHFLFVIIIDRTQGLGWSLCLYTKDTVEVVLSANTTHHPSVDMLSDALQVSTHIVT